MKKKYIKPQVNLNTEIWKRHTSMYHNGIFIDCYVSNFGRIKDLDGNIKQFGNPKGYYTYKCKHVHRIVAETFIPNPENKPYVDHIDRNKYNNKVVNLRWATISENVKNSDRPCGCKKCTITSKFPYCKEFNLTVGQTFNTCTDLCKYINRCNAKVTAWRKRGWVV